MPATEQKKMNALIARIETALESLKALVASQGAPAAKPLVKRGGMTPEGRARVAEAQRKRWAKQKRAAKKAALAKSHRS